MEDNFGESIPIGLYRSHDDIKNLKIRIIMKKVNPCDQVKSYSDKETSGDDQLLQGTQCENFSGYAERVFRWQEKVNCEVQSQASKDDANALNISSAILFSYTNDDFSLEEWLARRKTTCSSSNSNYLEKQNVAFANSKMCAHFVKSGCPKLVFSKKKQIIHKLNKQKAAFSHPFYSPGKFMSLVAFVKSPDSDDNEEMELCLLNLTTDGCLIIVPDFNNKDLPYIIRSKKADTFEYIIEHASDCIQDMETCVHKFDAAMFKCAIWKKMSCVYEMEIEQYIMSKVNRQHFSSATISEGRAIYLRPECSRIYLNGEIVSANNFEAGNLHIQYQLECSEGFTFLKEQYTSGNTFTCCNSHKSKNKVTYFGYPFSMEMETDMEDSNWKGMQLFVRVASVDLYGNQRNEGYGYCTIPLDPGECIVKIHTWKILPQSLFEKLHHYFIGGSLNLENLSDMKFSYNQSCYDFHSAICLPQSDFAYSHASQLHCLGVQLNKFGMKTESSGFITVKCYVLLQSK